MKATLKKVMIVGATSAIAYETAKLFAADHAELFLVGRNPEKLDSVCSDLKTRGAAKVDTYLLDLNEMDKHQALVDAAIKSLGRIDGVLIAHGTLGDQRAAELSAAETMKELNTNALSAISLLTILANYFEKQ